MSDDKAKIEELARKITKELADRGCLIEGGFRALLLHMGVQPNTSTMAQAEVDRLRLAFFAGAQHLFASIVSMLDSGDGTAEPDYRRLDLIDAELRAWTIQEKEFNKKV